MTTSHEADLAACRELLRVGSKSFHAASLLLPQRVRDPATALYAFCRLGDDAVDQAEDPLKGLAWMRQRLEAAYAGAPFDHPADRAFARTVEAYAIPRALPEALLEGFAWDSAGRRYGTFEALLDYCARVAGAVGAMMSLVMEARGPSALARATDLGTAMQLTNIARDVGEDARNGRLYLPMRWMRDAGVEPCGFLRNPTFTPALAQVVRRLLEEADRLYQRAEPGIGLLPRDCRPAIRAARLIYAEIGALVVGNGHDSVTRRAIVPGKRKLALVSRAFLPMRGGRAAFGTPPLRANAFLVNAVPAPELLLEGMTLNDRIGLAIEVFARGRGGA
ncbi:MAG: phytoene/squalene synthase family protein [Acetobacteraceae bacterium]|nr:phytoene/squalene synthase family protein [Acetobacteraceae bacterium]